jgi:DNA polymerase-3 subunit beta
MKLICDRESLASAYQMAAAVAPTRSPKPILQNVKLTAANDKTIMLASDTELGIRLDVPGVTIQSPGSVVLPVSQFGAILRESSDEKINIETDGNLIVIQGERSEFRLQAESPDEFPDVAEFEEKSFHEIPARLMKELVRRTLFATDTESSRYALGGVLLEFDEASVIAVGTDGRRLAKMEGPAQSVAGHPTTKNSTIVPTKAMHMIERALSDADAEIKVAARANDLVVQSPRATIYSRLVEGRFPQWRDILKDHSNASQIELPVGPFFSAVRQAAIVTSEESRGVDFTFDAGTLTLAGITADVGQSKIQVLISFDGPSIKISLDHHYVTDFLKVLDLEKSVTLFVENNEGPAQFHTEDGYTYVVMPMSRDAGGASQKPT